MVHVLYFGRKCEWVLILRWNWPYLLSLNWGRSFKSDFLRRAAIPLRRRIKGRMGTPARGSMLIRPERNHNFFYRVFEEYVTIANSCDLAQGRGNWSLKVTKMMYSYLVCTQKCIFLGQEVRGNRVFVLCSCTARFPPLHLPRLTEEYTVGRPLSLDVLFMYCFGSSGYQ